MINLKPLVADQPATQIPAPLPCLASPVCILGDIHGCLDPLDRLLEQIDLATTRLVCVGDYIDRGPHSAGVLARLQRLTQDHPQRVVCLMGNHERLLLNFLDAPVKAGPRWLNNGGIETLASFGISRGAGQTKEQRLTALAAALRAALPPGQEAWLRALPLMWRDGPLVVVHAAADPALPIDAQTEATLLWGHRSFVRTARTDGVWIAHGHETVKTPSATQGRIATDTGAWRGGKLTAALLAQGAVTFLQA